MSVSRYRWVWDSRHVYERPLRQHGGVLPLRVYGRDGSGPGWTRLCWWVSVLFPGMVCVLILVLWQIVISHQFQLKINMPLKQLQGTFVFCWFWRPRGQNRCEHHHLLLKRSRSEIIFNTIFRLKLLQWTFLFFVDSGGPYKQNVRQIWGWKRVNFVLVQYHKTAEQLLSSGCEK